MTLPESTRPTHSQRPQRSPSLTTHSITPADLIILRRVLRTRWNDEPSQRRERERPLATNREERGREQAHGRGVRYTQLFTRTWQEGKVAHSFFVLTFTQPLLLLLLAPHQGDNRSVPPPSRSFPHAMGSRAKTPIESRTSTKCPWRRKRRRRCTGEGTHNDMFKEGKTLAEETKFPSF